MLAFAEQNYVKSIALFICLVAAAIQLFQGEFFTYIAWGDRDLVRAAELGTTFQVWGAELNKLNGARTIGGSVYYIFYLISIFVSEANQIFNVLTVLYLISVATLSYFIFKLYGFYSGILTFLFVVLSIVSKDVTNQLWNPFVGYIFTIFGLSFVIFALQKGRFLPSFFAFFFFGLAAQAQMANWAILFGILAVLIWKFPKRGLVFAVSGIFVSFLPVLTNIFLNFPAAEAIPTAVSGTIIFDNLGILFEIKEIVLKYWARASNLHITNFQIKAPFLTVMTGLLFVCIFLFRNNINDPRRHETNLQFSAALTFVSIYFLSMIFLTLGSPYSSLNEFVFGSNTKRYYLPLVPIAAVFVATGLTALSAIIPGKKQRIFLFAFGLFILLDLGGALLFGVFKLRAELKSDGQYGGRSILHTYKAQQNLLKDIVHTFGFSKMQLLEQVSFGIFDGKYVNWESLPLEYQINSISDTNFNSSEPTCVLVIDLSTLNPYQRATTNEIAIILDSIKNKGAIGLPANLFASMTYDRRDNYLLVRYHDVNKNCSRSFDNQMLRTAGERQILKHLGKADPSNIKVTRIKNQKRPTYIGSIPMHDGGYPLTYMIEAFYDSKNQLYWKLHSKQLRNSIMELLWINITNLVRKSKSKKLSGLGFLSTVIAENSKIILTNRSGEIISIPIFGNELGSNGQTTPWRSSTKTVKPDFYRVELKIQKLGRIKNPGRTRYRVGDHIGSEGIDVDQIIDGKLALGIKKSK